MPADNQYNDLKNQVDQLATNDATENTAYQAQIDTLTASLTTTNTSLSEVTAERDAAQSLLTAQESRIAALEAQATDYESRLDLLEA